MVHFVRSIPITGYPILNLDTRLQSLFQDIALNRVRRKPVAKRMKYGCTLFRKRIRLHFCNNLFEHIIFQRPMLSSYTTVSTERCTAMGMHTNRFVRGSSGSIMLNESGAKKRIACAGKGA